MKQHNIHTEPGSRNQYKQHITFFCENRRIILEHHRRTRHIETLLIAKGHKPGNKDSKENRAITGRGPRDCKR